MAVTPPRGVLRDLLLAGFDYAKIAWWGLVAPRTTEREPLVVVQAVIEDERGVLLAVRTDLRGWELPGGTVEPGETFEEGLRREVREETGLEIAVEAPTGTYERTGFRPHTARVYRCSATGGALRTQAAETRRLAWFPRDALPETLFPWYRGPIADAARGGEPVRAVEHQGIETIFQALAIDLRMRATGDAAGR